MGLVEKLRVPELVKQFPAYYGIRRFTTVFITARNLSLSCASSIKILILENLLQYYLPILNGAQRRFSSLP